MTPKKCSNYQNVNEVCGESSYFEKARRNLVLGSTIIKINIRRKGKVTKKRFLAHYCLDGHSGIHD